MKRAMFVRAVSCMVAVVLWSVGMAAMAATANIIPSADNTVAEDFPDNSSGQCDSLFSGNTDNPPGVGSARRALMQFNIAGNIPAGSTINSATLSMTVTRGSNHVDSTFTLHPVTAAWNEGVEGCGVRGGGQGEPSTGGVTWNTQPGFGAASGSTVINNTAPTWSSAGMTSDVANWYANPGSNFGWILIGDENNPTTTRRFDSREAGSPPVLTVDFDPPAGSVACCFADGACNLQTDDAACTAAGGDPLVPQTNTCSPNDCPQPQGACCNSDRTCTDNVDKVACETGGGTFAGGNCNQADCGLQPFVEALPIPPVLQPTGTNAQGYPQYTVSVQEAVQNVHPDLPNTTVWTYNGAWPAATIVAVKDQPIEVIYQNNLPTNRGGNRGSNILEVDTCAHGPNDWGDAKRISTHLHGGHVPARVDGQPEYTILPGESDTYLYPNNQEAGTVWYHDHALGITRLNVYGGMAGFYLIADSEDTLGPNNAFGLPSGPYEIGLAIQDRTFNPDGSLFYNQQLEDAFKGEYVVVNGKINPFLNVDQGKYRFRILNGSQSREYIYRLENITDPGNDPSFTLVGTDLGLISAPIELGNSTANAQGPGIIGPAERLDVVIDFAGYPAGTEIILRNDDVTTPLLPSIMKFIVTGNTGHIGAIASPLRPVTPMTAGSADGTRYFRLARHQGAACKDGSGRTATEWVIQSLDGPGGDVTGEYWDDLTEFPVLGTREIWEFENPTNSYHPMHVHLVKFQILDKTDLNTGQPIPLQPWELNTWKDIVHIPANTRARIIMDFEDYPGRFPNHCHLLDHEDHEMMRQFQTTGGQCDNDGTCESGEDCQSCPGDCAQVSGASCGNGLCEAGDGENCLSCPQDCAGKQSGKQSNQFCCGSTGGINNIGCGVDAADNRCIDASNNLFCRVTPRLSACCGDALCEGQETEASCANDCSPSACVPLENNEKTFCFDGNDNDCDNVIDCADTADCEGEIGPVTNCGLGVCAANGNLTCSGGAETDTCVPGTPTEPGVELSCGDGLDNDCDGLTDSADSDCSGGVVCSDILDRNICNNEPTCEWQGSPKNGQCVSNVCIPNETPELSCNDGVDNDCDGLTDCADTADCGSAPACQQADCSQFGDKNSCNAQATCRWDNRNSVCIAN